MEGLFSLAYIPIAGGEVLLIPELTKNNLCYAVFLLWSHTIRYCRKSNILPTRIFVKLGVRIPTKYSMWPSYLCMKLITFSFVNIFIITF